MRVIDIKNKSNGKVICRNCEIAENFISKAIGLMFNRKKDRNIFFVFENESKNPIHSIFVFSEFYAIYIDKNMKVTEVIKVRPFSKWVENKTPSKYLLETIKPDSVPKKGEEIKCSDGRFLK
ncbi:MAG: DUF192 domain-containing protein [Candidatus ainarchaeum sp.]|nr:DUF192 domain-containing protein [Candidatus ainarchaeum sp.]